MHVPWRLTSPRDNGQNHVHRRQRIELDDKVQLASQVYSTTAIDEIAESGSRQWTKIWQKLDMMPAWQLEKVKNQKENILEEKGNTKKVHFLLQLWTFVSSLFAELEPKRQKCTGRAVFRGDIVKDESGTNAAFFF